MTLFLTREPLWISGLILVGLGTTLAMLGPLLIRQFVTLDKLAINNEVAGFKFATVGVLYAVLLGFSVIVVWQKFADADDTVDKEGGAAAALYHLSRGIGGAPGAALRGALSGYLKSAVTEEWPAMGDGHESGSTRQALEAIYTALLAANSGNQNIALMSEIFYQLDVLTQARSAQLVAAEGAMPGVVGNSCRRCSRYNCIYVLLRNAKFARAGTHDRAPFDSHLLGTVGHRCHRQAVYGHCQGWACSARRCAGRFRALATELPSTAYLTPPCRRRAHPKSRERNIRLIGPSTLP